MLSEVELERRKIELIARREYLMSRMNAINADYARGLDSDWQEQAAQLENAEVLQEISRVSAEELRKVEDGIERLEHAIELAHREELANM